MRFLLLLVPAILLFGCVITGCPLYSLPPPEYMEQCEAKGGHIQSNVDWLTLCAGPPFCADANGNWIEITAPSPTPMPSRTPTATPISDELRGARCISSGGTWDFGFCECEGRAYDYDSGECYDCPEGQLVGRGLGYPFCFTPSGKAGEPCDRETECNGGYCILEDASLSSGKGYCADLPFGCHVFIDENGEFDPEMMLCVD